MSYKKIVMFVVVEISLRISLCNISLIILLCLCSELGMTYVASCHEQLQQLTTYKLTNIIILHNKYLNAKYI